MTEETQRRSVGARIPLQAFIAAGIAIALVVGGLFLYRGLSEEQAHREIVIATGPATGTYHALGKALKRVLEGTGQFSSVVIRETEGSVDNMRLIREDNSDVDFAFVQGDASPSTNARLVTSLYEEALHILIAAEDEQRIDSIFDLQGLKVSLGAEGSGTRELSHRVLDHFDVDVGEDLVMAPAEAAAALAEDSIDAALLLSALPSRLVDNLAETDTIRFISLGDSLSEGDEAHALELVFPGIHRSTIPRHTYARLPRRAVYTVGVTALLVARKDTDERLVRDITETLFGYRTGNGGLEGQELAVARRIRENYDPAATAIPYHPGAAAYYHREDPPFVVEYAEALSLALTLMLALYSTFIALRQWLRRTRKNRVDAYLVRAEELATNLHAFDQETLVERHAALEALRREAFADLVAEKLQADEAFIILQNHLRNELGAIEARLDRLERER